jgi:hypothetical protein
VVDALRVALDDDVRVFDGPRLCLAVDEGGHLVSDAKLKAARRCDRGEHGVERILEPAGEQLVVGRRRPE